MTSEDGDPTPPFRGRASSEGDRGGPEARADTERALIQGMSTELRLLDQQARELLQGADELSRRISNLAQTLNSVLAGSVDESPSEPLRARAPASEASTDAIRLIAAHMIAAGGEADEVARQLHDEFGFHEPESPLNDLLASPRDAEDG